MRTVFSEARHKICQNIGFLRPVYSCIRESVLIFHVHISEINISGGEKVQFKK